MLKTLLFMGTCFLIAETSEAVRCHRIRVPEDCTLDESGECYWNYGESVCRYRFNSPAFCLMMPNYESCVISFGCFWDTESLTCENMWDDNNNGPLKLLQN